MKKKIILPLVYLLFIFSIKVSALGEGNFWFFGSNAGLDFNSGSPVALTVGALNTSEGCAAISDRFGNLLFYTDGITVWNKMHLVMPGGTGLFGDPSSTQSGIIVPKPGSPSHYYIFTTPAEGGDVGLCYTEIDMLLDGGLGNVVTGTKNTFLHEPVTEKLTAVRKADGINFWVIAHENLTSKYYVYSVTSAGVATTPVISTTGTIDASGTGIGYLKASSDGSKLASAMDNIDSVDILDFDNTTGTVSFDFTFSFIHAYGVEFSPSGKRLYVAGDGSRDLYQFDMTLATSTAIIASRTFIGRTLSFGLGAIQNAPDKKMYVTRQGDDTLCCIKYPELLGTACGFVDGGVYLADRWGVFGLPNFIPAFFPTSSIYYKNTCVGDTTLFSLADSIVVDSIHWNFGDSASLNNSAITYTASHVFSGVGIYSVSVITYHGGIADTTTSKVEIFGMPHIFLGNDTAICTGDSITLDAGSGYSYFWQDSTTNQTFRTPAGGTYYVGAIGSCGTDYDTIHIAAIPLPVLTVTNDTICFGQTAHITAHGADVYFWEADTTITDSVFSIHPTATTNYIVTGTIGFCSSKDSSTVEVNPLPPVAATSASVCIGNTTTIIASGASSYLWSTSAATDSITVTPSVTTTYTVTGTATTGCSDTATGTVTVQTSPVIVLSSDTTIIAGSVATLSAMGGTGYNWSPSTNLSCTSCATPIAAPLQTTTYCVVVNNDLCAAMACLTVNVEQPCPDVTELGVPNAFSPNNDGNNDLFLLQGWDGCIKEFNITIYDRWGEKVFESADVNFSWDGIYRKKALDPGVFVYYISARLVSGTFIERKGNITLIR